MCSNCDNHYTDATDPIHFLEQVNAQMGGQGFLKGTVLYFYSPFYAYGVALTNFLKFGILRYSRVNPEYQWTLIVQQARILDVVNALKSYEPFLNEATIPTYWTGVTVPHIRPYLTLAPVEKTVIVEKKKTYWEKLTHWFWSLFKK